MAQLDSTNNAPPDGGRIIAGFEQILQTVGRSDCREIAQELFNTVKDQGFSSSAAASLLDSGAPSIRDSWNSLLDNERSEALGSLIAPYCGGRTADLLSGTGSVARWLRQHRNVDIVAYERLDQYQAFQFPTRDFADLAEGGKDYETVLALAVLHHELSPADFMGSISRLGAKRAVVVENCLVEDWPQDTHDYMDSFYNLTLNQFGVDCPGQHRSELEWVNFLGSFGIVLESETLPPIPGIPFPYHLFVVELF